MCAATLSTNCDQIISNANNKIINFENIININDPKRQLKLGYSIISLKNKVIKSVKEVKKGDIVDIKISDGNIKSEIKHIKK